MKLSEGIIVGGDLSLRSSALVAMDLQYNLLDFELVTPSKDYFNDEDLLNYNAWQMVHFLRRFDSADIKGIVLENLSFGDQKSREYDMICANFWHTRWQIWNSEDLNHIPLGVVPVESWRAKVLSPAEKKEWKQNEGKLGLKLGVVSKLPPEVHQRFAAMITGRGLKYKKEKNPMFDFADAYFLTKYRVGLE
jgi:hypothetical protein